MSYCYTSLQILTVTEELGPSQISTFYHPLQRVFQVEETFPH